MGKLLSIYITVVCIIILQHVCEGFRFPFGSLDEDYEFSNDLVPSRIIEEYEDIIESMKRQIYRRRTHYLDICKCKNESCFCCEKFWKYKVCQNLKLIETGNDTKDLAIEFDISMNGKNIFTDLLSLSDLPTLCYTRGELSVCAIFEFISLRTPLQHQFRLCGQLELKFSSTVLGRFKVFCLKIGRNHKKCDERNKEDSIELSTSSYENEY